MSSILSIGMVVAAVMLVFVATRSDPKRHHPKRETEVIPVTPEPAPGRRQPKASGAGTLDERSRLRTDRFDLQSAAGVDFATRELPNRIWPPLR